MEQVDELLNEVKPSTKKTEAVMQFVEKLRSLLFRMKTGKCDRQVILMLSYQSYCVIFCMVLFLDASR